MPSRGLIVHLLAWPPDTVGEEAVGSTDRDRKVLGDSVTHVVLLLSRDFLLLVAIGFVIGAPVAYYLMNDWLAEFAFHTTLGVGLFVVAAGAVLVIASGTVGYQSVKAALANPADSLRSE